MSWRVCVSLYVAADRDEDLKPVVLNVVKKARGQHAAHTA